jgi:hypothetical protein
MINDAKLQANSIPGNITSEKIIEGENYQGEAQTASFMLITCIVCLVCPLLLHDS